MTVSAELGAMLLGVVISLAGGVIWMVRLEGRVNLLHRVLENHLDDAKSQYHQLILRMDGLAAKLDKLTLNCVANQHLRPDPYGAGASLHRRADDDEDGA